MTRPHSIVTPFIVAALLGASHVAAQTRPATSDSRVQQGAGVGAEDALRPGDVIRLRIWREPDLSGEFAVDETGVAVLPKVGPMQVAAESATSLRTKIVSAYTAFLNHTSIDVTLLRRVQVLGAVRDPGVYPIDPTMTISDVLAVAGGATPEGDPNRLELIRAGSRIPGRIPRQSLVGESRVRSGDQIFVPERSWVRRNSGFLVGTGLTTAVSVILTLATR